MRVLVTGASGFIGSSEITRDKLGWRPTGPLLLADVDSDHYFAKAPG